MKKLTLMAALLALPVWLFAQTLEEWNDVSVSSMNREESHMLALPENYQMSLNGKWKFNWVADPSQRPANFYMANYNDASWDEIDVPSSWQVYGVQHGKNWDKPLYSNVNYPFTYDGNYRVQVSPNNNYTYNSQMSNPVGSYRYKFTVPANWDGRDVFIRFNGAGHGYYVWVNGDYLGYAEDSYLPSEFKLKNENVKFGEENVVAVQVYRFTSGSFLEDQDYWRLTGIMRDVILWSAPTTRIQDYFFRTTELRDNNTAANVTTTVEMNQPNNGYQAKVTVKDGTTEKYSGSYTFQNNNTHDFQFTVNNIEAWSAENPKLYDLNVELYDNQNKLIDSRTQKVGFHTVGVRDDGALLVNGKETIIYGINRHSFSETGGRTITREEVEAEIKLMKQLNIKAVRTAHYPDNPYFYELCDQYGLYVLSEANLECHGNSGISNVAAFRAPMVERNERMVKTLRNHACIFMWSFGNESGNGNNFSAVSEAIRRLDNTRLLHYEPVNNEWNDMSSTTYPSVERVREIGEQRLNEYRTSGKTRPHLQNENTHAMGNSMGNQREYFDLYEQYPALIGEFIWDFKDQGLQMPINGNTDLSTINSPLSTENYWAYGGDFGDYPNDKNFCCNGLVFADLSYSAKAMNVKKIYQPLDFFEVADNPGHYTLKSRLAQRQLNDLNVSWEILGDDGVVRRTGTIAVDLAPGATQEVDLTADIAAIEPTDAAELFIRFSAKQKNATLWAPAGYEVANEQFQLVNNPRDLYTSDETEPLTIAQNGGTVTVTGKRFVAEFSQGTLARYTYNGTQLINQPLKFNAFRLPTDNDVNQTANWDNLGLRSLTTTAGTWTVEKADDDRSVTLSITNRHSSASIAFDTEMQFEVLNDGVIITNSVITPTQTNVILPRIGFRLEMPGQFKQMSWFGRGPLDSYADRKESQFVGLYESTVDKQMDKYVLPQEMGNKEEVRWMAVHDNSKGMLFVAPNKMAASTAKWRPEENYTNRDNRKKHPYEMTLTTNTVVNLDAAMRGLGNASCGFDVREKYELRSRKMAFNFIMLPLDEFGNAQDLAEKARVGCGESYRVDKSKWKVISCDSEQTTGGEIDESKNAIDDNINTIWHTQWTPNETACPHEIVVDMEKTYRVTSFIYQGRITGNNNGRVKEYELFFGNHPTVFGEPVERGTLADTGDEQIIPIISKPKARYFKLVVYGSYGGNQDIWASAAELGIEAEDEVDPVESPFAELDETVRYRLKENQSGMYLHYKNVGGANYQGDFCLGNPVDLNDETYLFNFTKVPGFTSFYHATVNGYHMGMGPEIWQYAGRGQGETDNKQDWIELEAQGNWVYKLRAPWQTFEYSNFDSRNVDSYVYPDKADGALFTLEPVNLVVLDENSTTAPTAQNNANVLVKRNISAGNWSTICLPFAMAADKVKAAFGQEVELADFVDYDVTYDSKGNPQHLTINFEPVTAMEANHPYIIKVSRAINEFYALNVDITPENSPVDAYTVNGTTKGRFIGTYVANTSMPYTTGNRSVFISGNNFYYATQATKPIKGYRGYFWFSDEISMNGGMRMAFSKSTGISDISSPSDGGYYYNLGGLRVNKPTKGIYIKNGKKVVIK